MCRNPMFAEQWLDHNLPQKPKIIGSAKNYTLEMKKNLEEVVKKHSKKLLILNCGHCIDCRLNKSREWATRCMLEAKEHQNKYFITLTYDNEHLPINEGVDITTGEIIKTPTLKKEDLQNFWKRLRMHYERKYGIKNKLRYVGCGEYGDQLNRPHYHAIVFGLPIFDLKTDHKSKRGNMNYKSKEWQEIWGNGIVAIGDVTWESCAYTARYVMKKQTGLGKEIYKIENRESEFPCYSKRPAIAKNFFQENWQKIYDNDEIYIKTKDGVKGVKPARYFDKLFDVIDHESMNKIKRNRVENAEIRQLQLEKSTDKDWADVIKDNEEGKDLKIKSLKRNFERGYI